MLYDQCIIHSILLLVNLWLDKTVNNILKFSRYYLFIFLQL